MIEFTVKYNGALAEYKVSGYEHDFDADVDLATKDTEKLVEYPKYYYKFGK